MTQASPRRALSVMAFGLLLQAGYPLTSHAQGVIFVHDGMDLSQHTVRGQLRATADVKAGKMKFYLPVCAFPVARQVDIRRIELRKALYRVSNIVAMADPCNDLLPDGVQQEAYVRGYNAVMDPVIGRRLGSNWKELIEKQVEAQLRRRPAGRVQAR